MNRVIARSIEDELDELEGMGYGRDEPVLARPSRKGRRAGRERPRPRQRRNPEDEWEAGCAEWFRHVRALRAEYE